jgi:hypothetical protein
VTTPGEGTLARVVHDPAMSNEQRGAVNLLMKRSGVTFFTRRVLQRWLRGEISTDTAIELIESDDAVRIVAAWRPRPE